MKPILITFFTILLSVRCEKITDNWYVQIMGNNNFATTTRIPQDSYSMILPKQTGGPLFADNDVKERWIGNSTFHFSNQFSYNIAEAGERVLLVFHGIDTFSNISFNRHKLGKTSNMFTRYVFDVKKYLKNGMNILIIVLDSAVKIAADSFKKQAENYVVYPKCVPTTYKGECHVNHIRKMQASFSWDWGPAIPASGIWKDVELVSIKDAVIIDHTVDVYYVKENNEWKVNATLLLENIANSPSAPVEGNLEATLIIENKKSRSSELILESKNISITNGQNQNLVSITLTVSDSKILRWWPNGYGDQNLYNLNISFVTKKTSKVVKTKRIGFRTIELVQEPLKNGLSFFFRVNNIPIFAKGSNLIPVSLFPGKSSNLTIREHLLRYSKEVHMNMLRIWGGGVYENDYFYEIADEYGIMIWQDFMFACSMYPTTDEFLASVKEEVIQNVWRLKSHASVVIWAGNNENEAALYGNWYGTKNSQIYKDDYIKLYVDVIKKEVEQLDKTRPFIVSSPTNAKYSDDNGYVGTNPYSTFYGDTHYYNYLVDGWDISSYPRPRFSSEYGFQSYPSITTLRAASKNPKKDLVLNSEFLSHRQHLLGGNSYMKFLISRNLNIPETNNSLQDFESYVYLSQVNQAQAVKVQTESYRQAKSFLNEAGEGMTMGALYWQLNDVWQAPTWSSIDFDGRWKLLHHFAEDFFAPIIISPRLAEKEKILFIFIVSDLLTTVDNCIIEVNVHKIWESIQTTIYTHTISGVSVKANEAIELQISWDDLLRNASCTDKKCLVELSLSNNSRNRIAPLNYVYPIPPKDIALPACEFIASFDQFSSSNGTFYNKHKVIIKSRCSQLFVRFEAGGYFEGRFSENGFHVLNGKKELFFYSDKSFDWIGLAIRGMKVMALGQIYQTPMMSNTICLNCLN